MPRIKRPEQDIQRAVFQHLRQRGAPEVFAFHPANGGKRTKTEASILKGLGVVAGVPDVICIRGGVPYCLELKTNHGRTTAQQEATLNLMHQAGAVVAIAYGLDEALARLEQWDLLRKDRSTDYDPVKDVEGAFNECYSAVRKRVAAGGKGWTPR